MIQLICFILFSNHVIQAANQCDSDGFITYLRSVGYSSNEETRIVHEAFTLSKCADRCTTLNNTFDCNSFEYDSMKLRCGLKNGNGEPFGASALMYGPLHTTAFFQQICLPITAQFGCKSPFAFERFPQHILVGNALERGVCFHGRSVMYYYETKECILNADNRITLPQLFTKENNDRIVDYFDNICYDVECPLNYALNWIKVPEFSINGRFEVVIEGITSNDCQQFCTENSINGEQFPCKLYAYGETSMNCHLTSESGLSRPKQRGNTNANEIKKNSLSFYEKICLKEPRECESISYEYLMDHTLQDVADKVIDSSTFSVCLEACLQEKDRCLTVLFYQDKEKCILSDKTRFSHPELSQFSPRVEYFHKTCKYVSQAEIQPEKFSIETEEEFLSTKPDISISEHQKHNSISNSNFEFDELKAGLLASKTLLSAASNYLESRASASLIKLKQPPSKIIIEHDIPFTDKDKYIRGLLESECGLEKITVRLLFPKPASGTIFIKDHLATCASKFDLQSEAKIVIVLSTLHSDNPPCPGREIKPSVWSFVVIAQRSDIDLAGLLTRNDRIFNITCDYSNMDFTDIRSNQIQPRIENESAVVGDGTDQQAEVRITILRNNQSVSRVFLGEDLEVRWTIHGRKEFDFFIHKCTAERLDGLPPYPTPLVLIFEGCITGNVGEKLLRQPLTKIKYGYSTKFNAFRFDGSRRVRLKCSIEICKHQCPKPDCVSDSRWLQRTYDKRSSDHYIAKQILPSASKDSFDTELVLGTITVDDAEAYQSITHEPVLKTIIRAGGLHNSYATHSNIEESLALRTLLQRPVEDQKVDDRDSICLPALPLAIILCIVFVLLAIQVFLFSRCIRNRCTNSTRTSCTHDYESAYHPSSTRISNLSKPGQTASSYLTDHSHHPLRQRAFYIN